jgi:hypothetical protein
MNLSLSKLSFLNPALTVSLLLGGALGVSAAENLVLEAVKSSTAWTISYGGKKMLVYSFAPQKYKPYVSELCTINGDNILRDAPHDHLHHHALMYGIKVNGINFWEDISGSGVQKVIDSPPPVLGSRSGLPQATIRQVIHWLAPQDAFLPNNTPVALLVENRVLVLTIDPRRQEVALEWTSQFEVGPKTNTVELTGSNYHGLGVRFLQEFDALAVHSLAGTRPDLANNRQDVSPAPWAAVSFAAAGRPATFAIAGHPSNARGDATYFSMLTPFSYLSATQSLDKEPLTYRQGDKFQLKYLVLTYPQPAPSEALRERISGWRGQ